MRYAAQTDAVGYHHRMCADHKDDSFTSEDFQVTRMLLEQQESDRGCVIFSAAMLEKELESLLREYCRKDSASVKKIVDPLFQVYAPFSTLSAKIQICYALGFIHVDLYKSLKLIRKLRNDFAHEKTPVSFQSPKYQPRLKRSKSSPYQ